VSAPSRHVGPLMPDERDQTGALKRLTQLRNELELLHDRDDGLPLATRFGQMLDEMIHAVRAAQDYTNA
jgi:hypothetical protein